MERIAVEVGEPVEITCGFSEAAMHTGLAGKRVYVMLMANKQTAMVLEPGKPGAPCPLSYSEAGIYRTSTGEYYGYRGG